MSTKIRSGRYSTAEALVLVLELACIVMLLLVPIEVLAPFIHRRNSRFVLSFAVFGESFLMLLLYVALVWWWRDRWTVSRGLSEYAAFGPPVGHVNAQFFAEFDGIAFIVGVAPLCGSIGRSPCTIRPKQTIRRRY